MENAFVAIVPTRPCPLFGRPVHRRDGSHRFRPGASPQALRIPPRGGHPALPDSHRGQRGVTPAFGYGALHPSTSGTSTHLSTSLPSAHYEPVRLPAAAAPRLWIPVARCQHPSAPRRVSQDPLLLCRRAPSPLTPGSPMRVFARCFRIGGRLQHLRKIGRCHWFNEAESGSASLGSRLRPRRLRRLARQRALPNRSVSRHQLPSDAGPELHVERAIHMADTSQSARPTGITLAQPKSTKTHEALVAPRCARLEEKLTC
jgi:hypothetical protein